MKFGRVAGCIFLASVLAFVGLLFGVMPTHAQQQVALQCYTPPCSKTPIKVVGHPPVNPVAPGKVITGFGGTAPGAPNSGPAPVAGKAPVVSGPSSAGKPVSTLPNTGGALAGGNDMLPSILVALAILALAGTMRMWGTNRT